jgi:hypothetical protein
MHPISYFPHQFQCHAQIKQFRSGDKFVPYLGQLKTITHPFQSLTLEKDYVVQVDYAQSDPINN